MYNMIYNRIDVYYNIQDQNTINKTNVFKCIHVSQCSFIYVQITIFQGKDLFSIFQTCK